MTFDDLCTYSGKTYCKKGYLKCMPKCRARNHNKRSVDKFSQLPDNKIRIKSHRR